MARFIPIPLGNESRSGLDNPSIPLSSPQAWAILAGQISTDAGVNVSEFTAMRSMAVWRCIHLLAGTVAQLPLHVWQGRSGDPNRTEIFPTWVENPNPETTWMEFMETSMAHILLWGNAFWLPVRTNSGTNIAQLWPLPPWTVEAARRPSTTKGVPGVKIYNVNLGEGLTLRDGECVHVPGLGYDGIRGLSPIAHCRQGLGLGIAAEQYGARLFGSGSLMAGIVSTDQKMTPEQAETMKARWRDKVAGLQKSHEVIVMDSGMKWTPIGIPPDDAQFLQTRGFAVEEVCRLYGVPPHLAMYTEKTTTWGTGIAEQSLGFLRYTISQWLVRFEQRITKWLCEPGTYVEFDTDKLLRADEYDRFATYNLALRSGVLSRNEVRARENLSHVDGLDDYAIPDVPLPVPPGKPSKGV